METLLSPANIATVGFPIAVAMYLLIRMEGAIKNLTHVVEKHDVLFRTLVQKGGFNNE